MALSTVINRVLERNSAVFFGALAKKKIDKIKRRSSKEPIKLKNEAASVKNKTVNSMSKRIDNR